MSHTLYETTVQRVQRCELAVPGSSPGMFEKALNSGVDFVFSRSGRCGRAGR